MNAAFEKLCGGVGGGLNDRLLGLTILIGSVRNAFLDGAVGVNPTALSDVKANSY